MKTGKYYLQYRLRWQIRNFEQKIARKLHLQRKTPKVYAGKRILTMEEANSYIEQKVRSGKPFAACRFGGVELNAFWRQDSLLPMGRRTRQDMINSMHINAGFFPPDSHAIERFADLMRTSCGKMDIFAVWFNPMEDYVIDTYGDMPEIMLLPALEPYYVENPWSLALAGKRVLVIHPFSDTILKQYQKRELLFENPDILPEFASLHVVKAVQTIAGNKDERFSDWFEALEWMYSEAMKIDFDVVIIGCGAYGFPLAAKFKEAGKQAIHMGGATQILFGIKGNRWESHPVISKLFNEHWVKPADSERPENINAVEGACYW